MTALRTVAGRGGSPTVFFVIGCLKGSERIHDAEAAVVWWVWMLKFGGGFGDRVSTARAKLPLSGGPAECGFRAWIGGEVARV